MKKFRQHMARGPAPTTTQAEPSARRGARPPDGSGSRYDALGVEEILAHLGELPATDLAKLGDHERAHQNRASVLAGIDALLDNEPWPGYDALDVTGVRTGLHAASREQLATVLAYERAHKNRADVLVATQQRTADGPA